MYRVATQIIIEQQPTDDSPNRNKTIYLDFCNSVESASSWTTLTDTAKITLPKNVKVKTENANGGYLNLGNLSGQGSNYGGFGSEPVFLRGDKVNILIGYRYFNSNGEEVKEIPSVFTGYISKVNSKTPFTLECEDNMWKLKQIQAPNKHWTGMSLNDIITECLQGTGFVVSTKSETSLTFDHGTLVTENDTVAHLLETLDKKYKINSYFRDEELRIGFPIYYEDEAELHTFDFQKNIIESDLLYSRRNDVVIGANVVARTITTTGTTKKGKPKTKKKRLEVFAGKRGGDLLTFYYTDANPTEAKMKTYGEDQLKKYYYDGFKGSFTTFGLPFVKFGDNVQIIDNVIGGRNGTYKVKKVEYSTGTGGVRQKITLDYKVDI